MMIDESSNRSEPAPPPAREPQPQPAPRERATPEGDGLDPTRYGDWEKNGRCIDF
ncbi:MAG: hypothetical protein OJF55_000507 [Rhodanobacteraceae bacterium]|jgi:hypothetical protein|nr:MAG: hypothetical protein OJF55_000507 [Rhodanobacteraceae bacterium]